ncbi:MAG TPA: hypothetical protein VGB17_10425 [Pyrinomonadaceae bacterium]|jgi:hypothetical protein
MSMEAWTYLFGRRSRALCAWLLLLVTLAAGCGGSLYRVKPVIEVPAAEKGGSATAGGINLRAAPLLSDEESQELFESNLPLAGLLAVRVELTNSSGAPIEFKRLRFRLRDGEGRAWKARSAKEAASRILEANAVMLYNPQARKSFEEALSRQTLDLKTPLAAAERRRGLIFFQTPKKEAIEGPRNLVLTLEGLEQPLELPLN